MLFSDCNRAILMESGRIAQLGPVQECVKTYSRPACLRSGGRVDLSPSSGVKRHGSGVARFEILQKLMNLAGDSISTVHFGEPVRLRLTIRSERNLRDVMLGFSFVAADGTEVQGTAMHDGGIANDLQLAFRFWSARLTDVAHAGRYSFRGRNFSLTETYEHIDEFLHF